MSLTSYWRAGKLEDGDYYIKTSGVIIPAYFDGLYFEGAFIARRNRNIHNPVKYPFRTYQGRNRRK